MKQNVRCHLPPSTGQHRAGRALVWPLLALLIASPLALASYWQQRPDQPAASTSADDASLELGEFPSNDPSDPATAPTEADGQPTAASDPQPTMAGSDIADTQDSAINEADAKLTEAALGTWTVHHYGTRVLTLKEDGTAKMKVTLDFIPALLYGEKLDFKLKWSIVDGVMTHKLISGTPKENVDKLIKDHGDSMSYKVMEITAEHILLRSESDGETEYDWKAVAVDQK